MSINRVTGALSRQKRWGLLVLVLATAFMSGCGSLSEIRNKAQQATSDSPELEQAFELGERVMMIHETTPKDTVFELARQYNPSIQDLGEIRQLVKEIKDLNGLRSDLVPVGRKLKIPVPPEIAEFEGRIDDKTLGKLVGKSDVSSEKMKRLDQLVDKLVRQKIAQLQQEMPSELEQQENYEPDLPIRSIADLLPDPVAMPETTVSSAEAVDVFETAVGNFVIQESPYANAVPDEPESGDDAENEIAISGRKLKLPKFKLPFSDR